MTDKIIEKIIGDAKSKADEIKSKAKTDAQSRSSVVDQEIRGMSQTIIENANKTAADRHERILAAEELNGKKLMLAKKQELVSLAFANAYKKLASLPDGEYNKVIEQMSQGLQGEKTLIPRDAKNGTGGGFTLKNGDVIINFSFEAIAKNSREKLEKDVVDILFG